jgi:hypothetical protein
MPEEIDDSEGAHEYLSGCLIVTPALVEVRPPVALVRLLRYCDRTPKADRQRQQRWFAVVNFGWCELVA